MLEDRFRALPYRMPSDVDQAGTPVAIIGAGPVGLALAADLALRGVNAVVLDDNDSVATGSRAICWAKRTLEIFDRLGIGVPMVEQGVTWQVGRLFHGEREVYAFDLLPEPGHKMPAFVNLQQFTVEALLIERCEDLGVDLRWRHKVVGHQESSDGVTLQVETPDGPYTLPAQYVVACDGVRSPTRERMRLAFEGHTFDEQFLIVDVEMETDPFGTDGVAERWFWFKPPFHAGQSALVHKQPHNIYRIDLQLSPDADPEEERRPETVLPRIRQIVGDTPFRLDWLSVYRFTCSRLERFVHGRVIFAGDSAHVVSPFGARGGNGGVQDVDNLAWKLAAVVRGEASDALLATYDSERQQAADENIMNSSRSTAFMTPKNAAEHHFRQAVLDLAGHAPFARRLVNSGRLSEPCRLAASPLSTGADGGSSDLRGTPCRDAPLTDGWLLNQLGDGFALLRCGHAAPSAPGVHTVTVALPGEPTVGANAMAADHWMAERYGMGMAYLVRPDQHICAVFEPGASAAAVIDALSRARGAALNALAA